MDEKIKTVEGVRNFLHDEYEKARKEHKTLEHRKALKRAVQSLDYGHDGSKLEACKNEIDRLKDENKDLYNELFWYKSNYESLNNKIEEKKKIKERLKRWLLSPFWFPIFLVRYIVKESKKQAKKF